MNASPAGPRDPQDVEPESGPRIRRAFERFAAEYTERAQTWLLLVGAPSTEAEDRVQDALEALWQHRFEVRSEVWPRWLRTAVRLRHQEARRAFRLAEKHAAALSYEAEMDAAEATPKTPEDEVAGEQTRAALRGMLDQLPPERRAVVELYLLEERSMEEVAAELGISEEGAWSRWRRARTELRERVERRRERERFAGGAISFGVVLALWRWVERRARAGLWLRESLRSVLVVASVATFVAGDAWVRAVPDATSVAAATRPLVALPASVVQANHAPAADGITPVRGAASSAHSLSAHAVSASSSSPAPSVHANRGQAREASAGTGAAAASDSSRRQAARAYMVRARAALHQEKNVAKARGVFVGLTAAGATTLVVSGATTIGLGIERASFHSQVLPSASSPSSECHGSRPAQASVCRQLVERFERRNTARTVAIGAAVSTAVTGTIAALLIGFDPDPSRPSITPVVSTNAGGIVVEGAW